jgi:hypothetical protein
MATVRVNPRSLPDPRDERVIRRIIRLTFCTLVGMLLALASLTMLVTAPRTEPYAQSAAVNTTPMLKDSPAP